MAARTRTSTRAAAAVPHPPHLALLQHAQELTAGRAAAARRSRRGRACRRRPPRTGRAWRCAASVKAPFSCPNSSLSIRVSGMAPQFTATNGRAAARREIVQGPGDQLLAGPALALDQHGGGGGRDLLHHPHHLLHRRAFGDQLRRAPRDLLAQPEVLPAQPLALLRLAQDEEHLVGAEGLAQIVVGAGLHRLDRQLVRCRTRSSRSPWSSGRSALRRPQQVEAVHLRHAHVGDQRVVVAQPRARAPPPRRRRPRAPRSPARGAARRGRAGSTPRRPRSARAAWIQCMRFRDGRTLPPSRTIPWRGGASRRQCGANARSTGRDHRRRSRRPHRRVPALQARSAGDGARGRPRARRRHQPDRRATRATASTSAATASSPRRRRSRTSGPRSSPTTCSIARARRASTTAASSSTTRSRPATRSASSACFESTRCVLSYLKARLVPDPNPKSFEDWVTSTGSAAALRDLLQDLHREGLGDELQGDLRRLGRPADQGPVPADGRSGTRSCRADGRRTRARSSRR